MKRKKTGIIISVVVIAIVLAVAVAYILGSNKRELKKQLDLGQKYLSEMNYEEAIATFTKAIEIDPMSVDAYLGIADAYIAIEKGHFDKEEIEEAKKAIAEGKSILEKGTEALKSAIANGNRGVTENDILLLSSKLEEVQGEIDKIEEYEEAKRLAEEAKRKAEEAEKKRAEEEERLAAMPFAAIQPILVSASDIYGRAWDEWTAEELIAANNLPYEGTTLDGSRVYYVERGGFSYYGSIGGPAGDCYSEHGIVYGVSPVGMSIDWDNAGAYEVSYSHNIVSVYGVEPLKKNLYLFCEANNIWCVEDALRYCGLTIDDFETDASDDYGNVWYKVRLRTEEDDHAVAQLHMEESGYKYFVIETKAPNGKTIDISFVDNEGFTVTLEYLCNPYLYYYAYY